MIEATLQGANIVVTRPAELGERLCREIAARGGRAIAFPALEIRALEAATPASQPAPRWIIFTSQHAVKHGLHVVRDWLAQGSRVAAIGKATAESIRSNGQQVHAYPPAGREESEGLLELPDFVQVTDNRVVIVRGRGGRQLLKATLEARGAKVELLEVYEGLLPVANTVTLLDEWREGRLHAIICTSAATLSNLHQLLDAEGRQYLQQTQLVVPTPRMIKLAQDFGIQPAPLVANGASDEALLVSLEHWWRGRQQDSL